MRLVAKSLIFFDLFANKAFKVSLPYSKWITKFAKGASLLNLIGEMALTYKNFDVGVKQIEYANQNKSAKQKRIENNGRSKDGCCDCVIF